MNLSCNIYPKVGKVEDTCGCKVPHRLCYQSWLCIDMISGLKRFL